MTGFTAQIEDGKVTTAKEFILLCARVFNRNLFEIGLSSSFPKEEDVVNASRKAYQEENLAKSIQTLNELQTRTAKEWQDSYEKHMKKAEALYKKEYEENEIHRARYKAITDELEKWQPKSERINEIKKFALDQIKCSIREIKREYYIVDYASVEHYMAKMIEQASVDISYWSQQIQKTQENAKLAKNWLTELKEDTDTLG